MNGLKDDTARSCCDGKAIILMLVWSLKMNLRPVEFITCGSSYDIMSSVVEEGDRDFSEDS